MKTLQQIYDKHKRGDWPDKNSVHSYIPIYEEILAPYRTSAKNILEIGLMSGESLRMWVEYFGGTVYGMDCDIKPINGLADLTGIISEGYNICITDATSREYFEKYFKEVRFDVVIEDAGHDVTQQLEIYSVLKPYMNEGGIYIIEDVQDINQHAYLFSRIGGEIIDRRKIKNRYDDVIIILRS